MYRVPFDDRGQISVPLMIGRRQNLPPIETDDPVELSSRTIDDGSTHELMNRVIQRMTPITDDIAMVESFSHVIAFRTDEGLLCFDSSGAHTGEQVVDALRTWSTDRVNTLVYTHGHVDHVGGSGAFAVDADARTYAPPTVVAHAAVRDRFERYDRTNDWNMSINARQFGGVRASLNMDIGHEVRFLGETTLWPDTEYVRDLDFSVGGLDAQLFHDKGETDDHTWAWIPEHKALCVGDFVTWVFPNCGNPQKVQRYPVEWAAALRKMMAYDADWLFGAHGLPIKGNERIQRVLGDLANALESLVEQTLDMMNAGESLDAIIHQVSIPEDELWRPWMMPVYDEPEFVVRNIWRLYGGWWDLNPANLKPAPEAALALEISALAGGTEPLVARARAFSQVGDDRLACHLIELAAAADPESQPVHAARAQIYQTRRDRDLSLMSKGIYAAAANESQAVVDGGG
ncbi:MAG: alkyl sulfatase dimerization domain-containing protein [Acidimicrobiales bacterium]